MKKYSLLIALTVVLAGCSPFLYVYDREDGRVYNRGDRVYSRDEHRPLSVREQLDRRTYSLNVEREVRYNPAAASRSGRVITNDVRNFVLSVEGDRFYNMREPNTEYRIANYRDTRNSQCRTIRFSTYYRRGNALEGKYELSVYSDGYFRLVVRNRNNSVRHEYEGWMARNHEMPGHHYPRR